MGVGGKAIPPDKIENIQSDAKFILLVEKEAAYIRITMSVERCSLSLAHCFDVNITSTDSDCLLFHSFA
jgi:hypothetical protein